MEKRKIRVLIFSHFFLPGYKAGGILRTVVNFVEHLEGKLELRVITSDRDSKETSSYDSIRVNEWNEYKSAKVYYASPDKCTMKHFSMLINETPHDILYLNSFFDYKFTVSVLLARRFNLIKTKSILLAPRGEFSDAALNLKGTKKKFFINVANLLGIYKKLVWQASSEYEEIDMKKRLGKIPIKILKSQDLPTYIDEQMLKIVKERVENVAMKVVFMSRIHPIKNLKFALEVLKQVQAPIIFNIYGFMDDEEYWRECENLASSLPKNIIVSYCGLAEFNDVHNIFALHDLFFLPTTSENYGHVIGEALSVGTPVLISDKTPWRNLEKNNVGWDIPLNDIDKFVEKINEYSSRLTNNVGLDRRAIIQWTNNHLDKDRLVENTVSMIAETIYLTN